MYRIHYHDDAAIVETTVCGFLTVEEFGVFTRDLQRTLAAAPRDRLPMSLYNYTEAAIQSQEVIALMQQLARGVAPGRKIALYTEGRLARSQARRVAQACPLMRVFDSRAEAIAWLTDMPVPVPMRIAAAA